jgi:hypothetical protein
MFNFYARISAPQTAVGSLLTTLAALTRLSRSQIRVFSADAAWTDWGI